MTEPSNIVPFPQLGTHEWIESYQQTCLTKHDEATIDAYMRILLMRGAQPHIINFAEDPPRVFREVDEKQRLVA